MNIEYISVSRLNTYQECAAKYKFKYHLKWVSEEPQQPYFLYGKLVHKIMEEYINSRGAKDLNIIRRDCLEGKTILEEGKYHIPREELPNQYLNKLPRHLKAFMKLNHKIGLEGTCEWKFHYDLDPPNNKVVHGFVDRLIQKDNQYIIIDYKTTQKGRWTKTKQNITDDLQLQCYALAVSKHFNVSPSQVSAALFYLDSEELVGAKFSANTIDATQKLLLKFYNTIEQADADKVVGRTGNHCYRCDFRNKCPFFALV